MAFKWTNLDFRKSPDDRSPPVQLNLHFQLDVVIVHPVSNYEFYLHLGVFCMNDIDWAFCNWVCWFTEAIHDFYFRDAKFPPFFWLSPASLYFNFFHWHQKLCCSFFRKPELACYQRISARSKSDGSEKTSEKKRHSGCRTMRSWHSTQTYCTCSDQQSCAMVRQKRHKVKIILQAGSARLPALAGTSCTPLYKMQL